MRDGGLEGVEAIIERQERVPPKGNNDGLLFAREYRRARLLRAGALVLDRGALGGFKWSSQRLDGGGCDEGWETALGSGATSRVAGVAWPTRRGAAGEPAAVLGGDCGGSVERGRGDRGRRVARGGGPLVPGG